MEERRRPEPPAFPADEAAPERVVGVLREEGRDGVVRPERPAGLGEVEVRRRDLNGAPFGMKVVVEILYRPDEDDRARSRGVPPPRARGRVVETLGDPADPDVGVAGILKAYGLEPEFPEAALREAEAFAPDPTEEEIARELAKGRVDLRGLEMVTIDGADAKDLDDAVSVEPRKGGGYRLGVHIADVSWYVREGSALDAEALRRGTSVYPPGHVIPMLPPRLSNGACSLNPQRPRFAFTVFVDLDAEGATVGHRIHPSLLRTAERMTYDDVFVLLSAPDGVAEDLKARYAPLMPAFRRMRDLAAILRARRFARGAMDFDFPETKVALDADGVPLDIHPYPTTFANGIVEEFMILANETVAEHFLRLGSPFAYRVHEPPDPDRLHRFSVLAATFGEIHRFDADGATSAALARVLEDVKGKPYGRLLARLLLRSLAKARYAPECLGHFGLASRYYCHFTSPIRRYPDLFIHRVMKAWRETAPDAKPGEMPRALSLRLAAYREAAEHVCLRSSWTERRAEQAERDVVAQKAAEYMARRLGEEYDGTVSGVVGAGMFVELDSTVEGFVLFATLDDYFEADEDGFWAKGRRTGETYHVGDRVAVRVVRADPATRRIDFHLVGRIGEPVGDSRRSAGKTGREREKAARKGGAGGQGKAKAGGKGGGGNRSGSARKGARRKRAGGPRGKGFKNRRGGRG